MWVRCGLRGLPRITLPTPLPCPALKQDPDEIVTSPNVAAHYLNASNPKQFINQTGCACLRQRGRGGAGWVGRTHRSSSPLRCCARRPADEPQSAFYTVTAPWVRFIALNNYVSAGAAEGRARLATSIRWLLAPCLRLPPPQLLLLLPAPAPCQAPADAWALPCGTASMQMPYVPGSRQYEWARAQLAAVDRADTPWLVVGGGSEWGWPGGRVPGAEGTTGQQQPKRWPHPHTPTRRPGRC